MRRRIDFSTAVAGLAIGLFASITSHAQEVPIPPGEGFQSAIRSLDFKVDNSTTGGIRVAHVIGKGEFPVRLAINDHTSRQIGSRLQVVVAVYVAEPGKFKPGAMVKVTTDPRILVADAGDVSEKSFELDIPLAPGDYKAFVFLCDPDIPYRATGAFYEEPYPDAEHFPGGIKRAKLVTLHVDPKA